MACATGPLTQEYLEDLDLAGELNQQEDSDPSDHEGICPFDEGTEFKPLECDFTPELDGSYPKSKLTRLLGPYNIFKRFFLNRNYKILENGGWHFSFIKSPERIVKKINAFCHGEFNKKEFKDIQNIEKKNNRIKRYI